MDRLGRLMQAILQQRRKYDGGSSEEKVEEVHFFWQCSRRAVWGWGQGGNLPTMQRWVKNMSLSPTFSSVPLLFGNWTTTKYCNDTCGYHRHRLEQRSCTPISPNLPEESRCTQSDTLRTSAMKCEDKSCKGKTASGKITCWDIAGVWEKWTEWSKCSSNCALGQYEGEITRQRNLKNDPFHEPDVQVLPCDGSCPPGRKILDLSFDSLLSPKIAQSTN